MVQNKNWKMNDEHSITLGMLNVAIIANCKRDSRGYVLRSEPRMYLWNGSLTIEFTNVGGLF